MMDAVLIGYGEVGRGLFGALSRYHKIGVVDPKFDMDAKYGWPCDILMIAIPYSEEFELAVEDYKLMFMPKETIIFSSVPIGTSAKLGAIHSPIEGLHNNMISSIRHHPRWMGGRSEIARDFFIQAGLEVCEAERPEITEFLKLQSTTIYGINLEWARYCAKMAEEIGFDFKILTLYNKDYNNLVLSVHREPKFVRYNLTAPVGNIGGHCILPNAKLLVKDHTHPFIQTLLDFNKE
jgi:hypothetical protein